jgi:hypothetical protein
MVFDHSQHVVIFGHARKRQFMEIAQPCLARAKVAHSQFADDERVYQNLLGIQQFAQSWNFALNVCCPNRGVDEDHDTFGRRRGPGWKSGWLPPNRANRRAASRWTISVSARLISADFSFTPEYFWALASNSSSIVIVVRMCGSYAHQK